MEFPVGVTASADLQRGLQEDLQRGHDQDWSKPSVGLRIPQGGRAAPLRAMPNLKPLPLSGPSCARLRRPLKVLRWRSEVTKGRSTVRPVGDQRHRGVVKADGGLKQAHRRPRRARRAEGHDMCAPHLAHSAPSLAVWALCSSDALPLRRSLALRRRLALCGSDAFPLRRSSAPTLCCYDAVLLGRLRRPDAWYLRGVTSAICGC